MKVETAMRRSKEWWASLTKPERSELVQLERAQYAPGCGWNIPDDCTECGSCGTPSIGSGLCPLCGKRLDELIRKADLGILEETK